MNAVSRIQKDKKLLTGAGYEYLSEEAITGHLHDAFSEAGLIIVPSDMEIISMEQEQTAKGSMQFHAIIRVAYTFYNVDSEEQIRVSAIGEGADYNDKALQKAMTSAYKYALRQSFVISTGIDADDTASEPIVMKTEPKKIEPKKAEPKAEPKETLKIEPAYIRKLAGGKGLTTAGLNAYLLKKFNTIHVSKLNDEQIAFVKAYIDKCEDSHIENANKAGEKMFPHKECTANAECKLLEGDNCSITKQYCGYLENK